MGKKARDKQKVGKKERRRAALAVSAIVPDSSLDGAGTEAMPTGVRLVRDGGDMQPIELAARLAGLGMVLQRQISRADAGDGLTRARLSALALLVLGGPRTLGELAAAEHVRPPTMTRLVHAMEADGLVERESNPTDRRSVILRATPRGEQLLERGRARQLEPLAASIRGLDLAERATLDSAVEFRGHMLREADRPPAASDG
jgi:DNA-binding MarR family transcriptional regulator